MNKPIILLVLCFRHFVYLSNWMMLRQLSMSQPGVNHGHQQLDLLRLKMHLLLSMSQPEDNHGHQQLDLFKLKMLHQLSMSHHGVVHGHLLLDSPRLKKRKDSTIPNSSTNGLKMLDLPNTDPKTHHQPSTNQLGSWSEKLTKLLRKVKKPTPKDLYLARKFQRRPFRNLTVHSEIGIRFELWYRDTMNKTFNEGKMLSADWKRSPMNTSN